MDIRQQNVLNNKGLNRKQLLIFSAISVLGVIFGLLFIVYYALIKYDLTYILIALIYFIIGLGSVIYVEKETRDKEKSKSGY